jgi:hypothetical protein
LVSRFRCIQGTCAVLCPGTMGNLDPVSTP